MPYLNVDDDFTEHPKVEVLSDAAFRLHVSAMRYAAKNLTDGLLPKNRVRRMVPRYRSSSLDELLGSEMWHEGGHGCGSKTCLKGGEGEYVIHDYLQWNKSRDWWTAKRGRDAQRQAEWRARHGSEDA